MPQKRHIITKKHLNEIMDELYNFRLERGLTTSCQQEGLLANLLKKLTEYGKAVNDEQRVNIICDIIIYILNASEPVRQFTTLTFKDCPNSLDLKDLVEKVLAIDCNKVDFTKFEALQKLCCLLNMVYLLGYDPYLALKETLKEASSKKGKYDNITKEFKKLPGFYSKDDIENLYPRDNLIIRETEHTFLIQNVGSCYTAEVSKWYKANYSICRI